MVLKIRAPNTHDRHVLLALARDMHQESPRFQGHLFSETKTLALVDYLIENEGAFIAEEEGRIIGMIAGIFCAHFFSDVQYVSDLAVYVVPAKRGGRAVFRLLQAFESWAFRADAREVLLGISTGIEVERTVALYRRLGYQVAGVALVKGRPK